MQASAVRQPETPEGRFLSLYDALKSRGFDHGQASSLAERIVLRIVPQRKPHYEPYDRSRLDRILDAMGETRWRTAELQRVCTDRFGYSLRTFYRDLKRLDHLGKIEREEFTWKKSTPPTHEAILVPAL